MVYERILPWYEGTSEVRLVMCSRHTTSSAQQTWNSKQQNLDRRNRSRRMSVRKTLPAKNMQAVVYVVECTKGIPGSLHRKWYTQPGKQYRSTTGRPTTQRADTKTHWRSSIGELIGKNGHQTYCPWTSHERGPTNNEEFERGGPIDKVKTKHRSRQQTEQLSARRGRGVAIFHLRTR